MTWSVEKLRVEIEGRLALCDVDLRLESGTVTAVVGGDGAGKTTLCRVLTGLLRPTSGSLSLPATIGYQPAGSGSWGDLTVRENLRFVGDAHRFSNAHFSERLGEMMEATALGPAIDRLAMHLSGGMRQKLGVAMALLPRPELAVLDEPTTGVDPVSRIELWQLITRSVTSGTTIVLTTTYLDEAARAGTILALEAGSPLAYGTLTEIGRLLPGALWSTDTQPSEPHRWRRGGVWRVWSPDGHSPPHESRLEPDLNDVLTALSLAANREGMKS